MSAEKSPFSNTSDGVNSSSLLQEKINGKINKIIKSFFIFLTFGLMLIHVGITSMHSKLTYCIYNKSIILFFSLFHYLNLK